MIIKKTYYILFLFSFFFLQSQNISIFYQLDYKPSKNIDTIRNDLYLLNIYPKENKSTFTNYAFYKTDSLMLVLKEKSNISGSVKLDISSLSQSKYPLCVSTENNKFSIFKTFDGDSYKLENNNSIKWNVTNEKKKIEEWNCQQAYCEYGGRKWIAWFAIDIPSPFGPYVFNNLPGLIVDISDAENEYHFSLKGISENNSPYYFPEIYQNSIVTTKQKYLKAYKNYVLDPGKKLREGYLVDGSGQVIKVNGGLSKKFIETRTNAFKKDIEENNNDIEKF